MNYGAIPNFLAIGMVVVLSFPLLRLKGQVRFRYWFAGWLVVLAHALIMVFDSGTVSAARSFWQSCADATIDSSLAVASILFICATGIPRRLAWYLPLLAALPNILALLCWDLEIVSHPLFYALIAAGAVTMICGILYGVFPYKGPPAYACLAIIAASLLQAGLLHFVSLDAAESWQMCWPYLAVAYLVWTGSAKLSIGTIVTSTSFLLWGSVFPIAWALSRYSPSLLIEAQIWNIPKFLAISGMILILLEQQLDKMNALAMLDPLTGLPNRRAYDERLEEAWQRAQRSGKKIAVLAIDLDNFKQVNDTLGHRGGDEFLQGVAARLRGSIRKVDMLARIGGDEFAVIVESAPGRDSANKVARALQDSLRQPFLVADTPLLANASVGTAIYPDDALDSQILLAIADARMYQAKSTARKQRSGQRQPASA
jgi:diguanylate cyclase (GGDEF)-like protein